MDYCKSPGKRASGNEQGGKVVKPIIDPYKAALKFPGETGATSVLSSGNRVRRLRELQRDEEEKPEERRGAFAWFRGLFS